MLIRLEGRTPKKDVNSTFHTERIVVLGGQFPIGRIRVSQGNEYSPEYQREHSVVAQSSYLSRVRPGTESQPHHSLAVWP